MRLYEKRGRLDVARARDVPEALSFLDGLKALHHSSSDKPLVNLVDFRIYSF